MAGQAVQSLLPLAHRHNRNVGHGTRYMLPC
jgi:hypothetical protein